MEISVTDLSNCDLELIHIPGKIQSHGFLLAVDKECIIRFISTNISQFIGEAYSFLLNKPLLEFEQFLKSKVPGDLTRFLCDSKIGQHGISISNPLKIQIKELHFNLIVSSANEFSLLEFEPINTFPDAEVQKMINRSIPGILEGNDLNSLLDYAATQVKSIIQFDRVMIYRFAPDGHGEVVAESKNEELEPWLGLHYPASDIPKQARELYKRNSTRIIADVNSPDIQITTTATQGVLDLTFSQLRAVSPVHIQYLKNMGVASSYSISLFYQKELWGLIACHNYTPRFIDYEIRESSKLVGQILSAALEFRQHEEDLQEQTFFQHNVDMLAKYLHSKSNLEAALTQQEVNLLHIVHCSGVVLFYDNKQVGLGQTPNETEIVALVSWISEKHPEGIFYTASLCHEYMPAESFKQIAAGIIVIPLSKEQNEFIIWFKAEILQQVKWAGDPAKMVSSSENGIMNISPRHSFDIWTKTVTGKSLEWTLEEINSVLRLKEEILTAISTKASATRILNERLRLAYEELDTFSYTVSHDLKTPLTAIKGYAQLLASDLNISVVTKQILQRIADRAEKMNFMIKAVLEYSRIGRLNDELNIIDTAEVIGEIIQDIQHSFQKSSTNITVGNLPAMRGDPVMIWQVFSNLIGNAVKYSQYAASPAIHIEGWTAEQKIFYTIKDNGIGIAQKDLDNIFLLFSRMSNVEDIEGTGVGLAIVKKIVEKHNGLIWAESELGVGTTFFLSFNAV